MLFRKVREQFQYIKDEDDINSIPLASVISEMNSDDNTLSFYRFSDKDDKDTIKLTLMFIGERPSNIKYIVFEDDNELLSIFNYEDKTLGDIAYIPGRSKHISLIDLRFRDIPQYFKIIKNKKVFSIDKDECESLMKDLYEEYANGDESKKASLLNIKKVFVGFYIELYKIYKKENNEKRVQELKEQIDCIGDALYKKHIKRISI